MTIDIGGVVDAVPALIWTTADDGGSDFTNRGWRAYTGLDSAASGGHGWHAAVHPEDLPKLRETWSEIQRTGEDLEIYVRLRRYDGEHRWHTLRPGLAPAGVGRGQRWCWLGMNADEGPVTDGRLQRLIDMLPLQVAFLNQAGTSEYSNRQTLDDYGMTLDQLAAWQTSGAIHVDDHPIVLEQLERLMTTGQMFDATLRMRYKDGGYRWMRSRCVPCRDAHGNFARYVTVQSDVHDLKLAEDLLAAEVRLLEMVARGETLTSVLDTLSRSVELLCSGAFCSVLLVAPDRKQFQAGAGPSLPDAYNAVLNGLVIDPTYGPCSLAVEQGAPIISSDIAQDPRWRGSSWPALVTSHGYASCWSLPIVSSSGEVSGVFALYRHEPVGPTEHEYELIERFAKIAGIAIDRDLADAALQASARELRETLAQLSEGQRLSQTGSFTSDIQQDQHRWSDEFYRIFEIDLDTTPRLEAVRARIHPDDLDLYDAEIGRALEGAGSDFTFRVVTPGAGLKHLRGVAQVVEHTMGRPIFMGTVQDITARRLAEEKLERSQASLAEGQRLSKTGSYSWLMDTDEAVVSDELRRIFGFNDDAPVTLDRFRERVHPEDLPLWTERMEAALSGDDTEYVFRARMPDGSIKHLRSFTRGATISKGRPELIGSVADITESKLAEEDLDQARSELAHVARVAALNAMTASIAHEVNQPLGAIRMNANTCLRMLERDPPNLDGAAETAQRTIRDANRATEVIRRLRSMFGKNTTLAEVVELNESAKEVIALSASELRRSGVVLKTEFAEALPAVTGDRIQLQQVILNLLLNAADAMVAVEDRPRTLVVRTDHDGPDAVQLSVRDVGMGLDPETAAKVFDAFFTTKPQGMGVGLSISRSIIESHAGRLWAEANDGPGATFGFRLPCGGLVAGGAGSAQERSI